MITELKVLNCFCEVTVKRVTLEADLRWQPFSVEFWERLFNQSPPGQLRNAYAQRLVEEKTRMEAVNKLSLCD